MSKFQNGDWGPWYSERDEFMQKVARALGTTAEELCDDDVYNMLRRIGEGVKSMDRRLRDLEAATDRIVERMQEISRPAVADALTEPHRAGSVPGFSTSDSLEHG